MKNILNKLIKNKTSLLVALVVVGVGLLTLSFVFLYMNTSVLKYKNDNYSFSYDRTWKIKTTKNNYIKLVHSNGEVEINITDLDNYSKYLDTSLIMDEVIYNMEEDNKDYKLINKEEDTITKYNYNGFKLLFENKKEEVLVNVFKKGEKLVIITFSANNKYFDMLLDSVNNIVNNFDLLEEKYAISTENDINLSKVSYKTNKKLEEKINKTKEYSISSNRYKVKYSIPDIFKSTIISSVMGSFRYEDGDITISAINLNANIYEYLEKKSETSIYTEYNLNQDDYKDNIEKINDKTYIFKNSYKSLDKNIENIVKIYELDNNHIFTIKITSTKNIPRKLVDNVNLEKYDSYYSNTKKNIKNDYLIGVLKDYSDYSNKNINAITLNLPKDFIEVDNNENLYKERSYVYKYDKNIDMYTYEISYKLLDYNTNIEDDINVFNTTFSTKDSYSQLSTDNNFTVNNKEFISYSGFYKDVSGIMYTNSRSIEYDVNKRVLYYLVSKDVYLRIVITSNNNIIDDEILKIVTNFTTK